MADTKNNYLGYNFDKFSDNKENGVTTKYLNYAGLVDFWANVKDYIDFQDLCRSGQNIPLYPRGTENNISITAAIEDLQNNQGELGSDIKDIITVENQDTLVKVNVEEGEGDNDGIYTISLNDDDLKNELENIKYSINVTYSELRNLRNNGNLKPGAKYRITDYETIVNSNEYDVISAGHKFDIIVEALNEYTLSEHALAAQRDDDGYFDDINLNAWKLWYCLDNDKNRFEWADDRSSWKAEFVGFYFNDPSNNDIYNSDKVFTDKIYDSGIAYDPELETDNIVIYKSDVDIYNEEGSADYSDLYFYRGIVSIDGHDYDSWKKYELGGDSEGNWVEVAIGSEQTCNKYALTERLVFNNQVIWPESTDLSENGKGVIYRMIDEYGNDCPYDFKNIMFYNNNWGKYIYTFTWIDNDETVIDASIAGNKSLKDDEYKNPGVYNNTIKPYFQGTQQYLNNIVFISDHQYDIGWYYGCRGNSFGDNCHNNSFGNSCSDNSFGNDCYNNSFGNGCGVNSFGNGCGVNSFGNSCGYNSFGNDCYSNSFGSDCVANSFGNDCYSNSFGNSCRTNSFRDRGAKSGRLLSYCRYNHFSDGCSYNVIWNDEQSSSSEYLQNVNITRGVSGLPSSYNFINIPTLIADYEIKIAKNSAGDIKVYCEADLIA